MSRADRSLVDPVIESGMIINVNMTKFTVDIATQFSYRRYLDIAWSSPYLHQFSGEGISVMPEVGCPVWVCKSSEPGSKPFVLGFGGMWNKEGSFRAARPNMNPGDIYIATRDKNCVFLHRGGIVQIQSTPLAQRMYLPVGNIIRDICEAYSLHSFAGDFLWEVDRDETTTTGDRPTRVRLLAKELADDPSPTATLIFGHQGGGRSDPVVSLEVSSGPGLSAKAEATLKGSSWALNGKTLIFERTIEGDKKAKQTLTFSGDADDLTELQDLLAALVAGEGIVVALVTSGGTTSVQFTTEEKGDVELVLDKAGTANPVLGFSTSSNTSGSGEDAGVVGVNMYVTKEGEVSWTAQAAWSVTTADTATLHAAKDMELKSDTEALLLGTNKVTVKSDTKVIVKAPKFQVGSEGIGIDVDLGPGPRVKLAAGEHPLVKGDVLKGILASLLASLSVFVPTDVASLASVKGSAGAGLLALNTMNSKKATTG